MFGYVQPDKPELKVREFDIFRGYYCSLCKSIGRSYGTIPRLSLNFDLAYLAVLLDSVRGGMTNGKMERCIAHPIKKRFVLESNPFIAYASDMNILLAYYNLKDKWADERNVLGACGTLAFNRAFKKAKKKHPDKAASIEALLNELNCLEKENCSSIDEAAEPFASIMREIFQCDLIEDVDTRKTLGWLGYNLGRWIYILDAWDDLEKDAKTNSYNPILRQYAYKHDNMETFKEEVKEKINFILTYSLSEAEKAHTLLGIYKNCGILDNIIYSGLIVKTDKVLQGRCKKHEKKSI